MSSGIVLRPLSQVGNIFAICSSTGQFLLDILNVVNTAIFSLPSPTLKPPETHITLAQGPAGTYQLSSMGGASIILTNWKKQSAS